jgi:hypothetical protein
VYWAFSLLEILIVALIEKFLFKASINKFNSSNVKALVCNFRPLLKKDPKGGL